MPASQETEITTFAAGDDEWWTPQWLVDASRSAMGGLIHLDPASTAAANERIKARVFYTREDNGLSRRWYGNVFLNPPSKRGDPLARPHLWAKKLVEGWDASHIFRAILIVKSVLGYNWYEELYERFPVCHLRERPRFVRSDGTVGGRAKKGVSVFCFGNSSDEVIFANRFQEYGRIILPNL